MSLRFHPKLKPLQPTPSPMFSSSAYRSPRLPGAWLDGIDRRSCRVSSRPYSSVSQSADSACPLSMREIVPRVSALLLPPQDVHAVL